MEGAIQKIRRAQQILTEIEAEIELGHTSGTVRVEYRPVRGGYVAVGLIAGNVQDIEWRIREALQHVRDALDKIVVSIVEDNQRGTSKVGFPFPGDQPTAEPHDVFEEHAHKELSKKLDDHQKEIVNRFAKDQVLFWLNKISNINKHKRGIVEFRAGIRNATSGTGYISELIHNPSEFDFAVAPQENGRVLLFIGNGSELDKIKISASFSASFSAGMPLEGHNAIEILRYALSRVSQMVEAFRPGSIVNSQTSNVVFLADFRKKSL